MTKVSHFDANHVEIEIEGYCFVLNRAKAETLRRQLVRHL